MEDHTIVSLFWSRSEEAIAETASKYGKFCYSIAYNILHDQQDADESVNDTYLDAWNTIPPQEPVLLSAFLGKITRRLSIDKWRKNNAGKRGGGQMVLALEELGECIPSVHRVDQELEAAELAKSIDRFLEKLPQTQRDLFVCRYWYLDSIAQLAGQFHFSQSKVKSMLYRTRKKLLQFLQEEGIF